MDPGLNTHREKVSNFFNRWNHTLFGQEKSVYMIGVLGHDPALGRLYWARDLGNQMNFVMNHAPGAGSIAQPVDQQSSALPLYHGCPQRKVRVMTDYGVIRQRLR